MPLRVIHLTALANEMISCRVFISTQSAEGRYILFFNGFLDYIRPQCLILCGSYKPFSLFLQIPVLQPIPWPLSLDLLCWAQYLAMKRLGLPLLNLLSFLLLIVCLWGFSFSLLNISSSSTVFLHWFRDVLNAIGQLHLFIKNTLLQVIQLTPPPPQSSKVGSVNICSWMKHTINSYLFFLCVVVVVVVFVFLFLSMASGSAFNYYS